MLCVLFSLLFSLLLLPFCAIVTRGFDEGARARFSCVSNSLFFPEAASQKEKRTNHMREKKKITRARERERKEQQNVFRSDDESAEAKNGSERLVGCYRE
jgi:hypothetical protein